MPILGQPPRESMTFYESIKLFVIQKYKVWLRYPFNNCITEEMLIARTSCKEPYQMMF
jgi:hypothetical protein